MKKITYLLLLILTVLPITIFAHDGHVHTGTFWENVGHFVLTNGYLVIPIAIVGFFLIRIVKKTKKVKIK